MSSLYNTEHIEISNNDDIITIMIKTDTFDNTITEPIKNIFDNLFNHYDSKQNNQFGCIFNLDILSTYNIYCYAKEFKNYFMQNAKKLDTHVYASVIVTSRTFIKCVIKPIIILTKSSNTCAFKKHTLEATTFLQNFKISHNNLDNNLDTWISPSPSQSTRLSTQNTDINLSNLVVLLQIVLLQIVLLQIVLLQIVLLQIVLLQIVLLQIVLLQIVLLQIVLLQIVLLQIVLLQIVLL